MADRSGRPPVGIYVAIAENGVIGRDGGLPWRLRADMLRFKEQTMGKPIVMGRKTWDSFPRKPLPGRTNIVVTRRTDLAAEGASVVSSLDAALDLAASEQPSEICVIGGGEIYRQILDRADMLHVTHVMASIDGDVTFPRIDPTVWRLEDEVALPADEANSHGVCFATYRRRQDAAI